MPDARGVVAAARHHLEQCHIPGSQHERERRAANALGPACAFPTLAFQELQEADCDVSLGVPGKTASGTASPCRSVVKQGRSSVALLPTYSDTYGFSVLEAQASGCPVITTNVRALPEINNQDIGWVISVPKDDQEDALFGTRTGNVAAHARS